MTLPSQPPGSPRESWLERMDAGSRAVIDRIDKYERMQKRRRKVRTAGWATVLTTLLGTAGAVFTGSKEAREAKLEASAARQEAAAAKELADEGFKELRQETVGKISNLEARVEGLWMLFIERKSRQAVREEARRRAEEE